ncbi:MAG: hypothetical protein ACLQU2_26210 [Candidatus Binataceae bacterium]
MIATLDEIRLTIHVLIIAGETYLYLQLLGFGLTHLLLRRRIISYQVWLAPWFGLMLAVIPLFWLSRLGMSTQRAFYVITIAGALLAVLCLVRRPRFVRPNGFDAWLAVGALATLAIALYPMLFVPNAPTTISLGNADPALYAVASDYLRSHSVARPPLPDALHPTTTIIGALLSPGHRPGAFLVLSLFDCLFHAPSYRVFSVVLAVLLALTTPLVAIFAHLVSGKRHCGKVALSLSVANVNFMYCYYAGFAAQVLVLGCIIATFILVLVDEREQSLANSHSIAVGFAMIAMILLVPEGAVFFIFPFVLYAVMQGVSGARSPRQLVRRYGLTIAVAVAAGMFPMWEGALWLHRISTIQFGSEIPHWALPVHLVGLMNATGVRHHSILITGSLSFVVLAAICWGLGQSRNRLLLAVLIGFNVIVLFYFGAIRHYSYAYYKAGVMDGFVFIAAFSAGLPVQLYRRLGATCGALTILSFIICRPVISAMAPPPVAVTAELSALSQIPSLITRGQVVSLDQLKLWDRLWASEFMPDVAVTAHDTLFSPRTPTLILRSRSLRDGTHPAQGGSDAVWANNQYLLIKADHPRAHGPA